MELLQKNDDKGYPAEYLLSRIKGRRVSLITDWEPLVLGAAPIDALLPLRQREHVESIASGLDWRGILREFRWVYLQMNKRLRDIFFPFFLYSELRTLFLCFRYKSAGDIKKVETILKHSLFSKKFIRVLATDESLIETLKRIEDTLTSLSIRFRGIVEVFSKDGLKGLERHLTERCLEYIINADLHPVLKTFFMRVIDSRNIIALYKNVRWGVKSEQDFIQGGTIGESRLRDAMRKEDIFGVLQIARTLTGISIAKPDASGVEAALYRGMTIFLKRTGREPSGIGLILDYLWRCSMEAMNLGVILYGRDIDGDIIRAELI